MHTNGYNEVTNLLKVHTQAYFTITCFHTDTLNL